MLGLHLVSLALFAIIDAEDEGYCAPYYGKVCRSHLINSQLVWYKTINGTPGGSKNEEITTNLWKELIVDLPDVCRGAAEVSSYFPLHRLFFISALYYCCRNFSVCMHFQHVCKIADLLACLFATKTA